MNFIVRINNNGTIQNIGCETREEADRIVSRHPPRPGLTVQVLVIESEKKEKK